MVNTELSIRNVKVAVEVLLFPHASVDVKATPIEELQEVVVQVWVKWLSLHTRLLSHKSVATAPPFVASHAIYPVFSFDQLLRKKHFHWRLELRWSVVEYQ